MNVADVIALVASASSDDPAISDCYGWIRTGRAKSHSDLVGGGSASSMFAICSIRRWTIEQAGIHPDGIASTLAALHALDPDARVAMCTFSDGTWVLQCFITEHERCVLGCIRVPHRAGRAKHPCAACGQDRYGERPYDGTLEARFGTCPSCGTRFGN